MRQTRNVAVALSEQLPAPTPDGRAVKRERILGAALKLFAQEPYQDVTMDRVAKLANVAKGTLYLYFSSKEELYLGILSDGLEKAVQNHPVDPKADMAERLRSAIAVSIDFYDRHRDFLRLLATEEPRLAAERNRLIDSFRQRGVEFFNQLIEEGIVNGTFRRTDARLATFAIMGAIRSVLLYYSPRRPVSELSGDLGRIMLDGLVNPTRTGARISAAAAAARNSSAK
jgi:AcrR family transcriptional regulator